VDLLTLTAIRFNPVRAGYFERLVAAGKPRMQAVGVRQPVGERPHRRAGSAARLTPHPSPPRGEGIRQDGIDRVGMSEWTNRRRSAAPTRVT
jgi:hypothetical protein